MSEILCPTCGKSVPLDDVNVKEGVALCRACGKLSRLSDIAGDGELPTRAQALSEPAPPGCRYEDDGVTMTVTASARSLGTALGALFFAAFWNSIVSVFVVVVATSLWTRLAGPLPAWVPSPISGSGGNSGPLPLGVSLFMVLFLTPFVAVGLFMIGMVFVSLFGHVAVRVREGEGSIFTGVGPIGRRRRFDALNVTSVRIVETRSDDSTNTNLVIEAGGKKIKVGSMLTPARRAWMGGVLRAVLLPGKD